MKFKTSSFVIIRRVSFIALPIISIVISSTSIGLSTWRKSFSNTTVQTRQTKTDAAQSCTDCLSDFYRTTDEQYDTMGRHVYNRSPCCHPTQSQIAELQSKMDSLKKRFKEKKRHQKISIAVTSVSVHKYLLSTDQVMNFSNVDHVTVQLDTRSNERNSNNHVRGVKVQNDGIEILHTGLYYVYSSIFYKPNTNVSSENFPYQTWFHYVYRTRPNSPAMSSVILRTVFTCCPNCSNSKDSVYIGGVFRLLAGDVIQVCLSGQGLMGTDTIKDSSYLGLFMLTSR